METLLRLAHGGLPREIREEFIKECPLSEWIPRGIPSSWVPHTTENFFIAMESGRGQIAKEIFRTVMRLPRLPGLLEWYIHSKEFFNKVLMSGNRTCIRILIGRIDPGHKVETKHFLQQSSPKVCDYLLEYITDEGILRKSMGSLIHCISAMKVYDPTAEDVEWAISNTSDEILFEIFKNAYSRMDTSQMKTLLESGRIPMSPEVRGMILSTAHVELVRMALAKKQKYH